ncbi:MAG: microsomal epoxide hydrolase [Nevskia sp.]|nr:microsomal epoxide hydrolase [Nevskia sp.]
MRAEPFVVDIDSQALADLSRRLEQVRWPADFANEDWRYGTNASYLKDLVDYWRQHYDWRRHERAMNVYPHFRTVIDGVPIHFIHQRSRAPKAIPLVLTHGWPWTYWDFNKVIGPLADPEAYGGNAADAFDVIVPSLPGFGFSSPLTTPGISFTRTADLWLALMNEVLGYPRFGAHGSDFGLVVTEQLGHRYAEQMIGVHVQGASPLDFFSGGAALASDYAPEDAERVARNAHFARSETGYMALQTTKPQTISYALHDSPVGLCAWILEKRRAWSDCGGDVEKRFSKDDLLTTVMLYWLTETYGTSARFYYESAHQLWQPSHARTPVIEAPTGVVLFAKDIIGMPRRWAERYCKLQRWTSVPHGGHFGAMEQPEILIHELREFFRPLRTA